MTDEDLDKHETTIKKLIAYRARWYMTRYLVDMQIGFKSIEAIREALDGLVKCIEETPTTPTQNKEKSNTFVQPNAVDLGLDFLDAQNLM